MEGGGGANKIHGFYGKKLLFGKKKETNEKKEDKWVEKNTRKNSSR